MLNPGFRPAWRKASVEHKVSAVPRRGGRVDENIGIAQRSSLGSGKHCFFLHAFGRPCRKVPRALGEPERSKVETAHLLAVSPKAEQKAPFPPPPPKKQTSLRAGAAENMRAGPARSDFQFGSMGVATTKARHRRSQPISRYTSAVFAIFAMVLRRHRHFFLSQRLLNQIPPAAFRCIPHSAGFWEGNGAMRSTSAAATLYEHFGGICGDRR